MRNIVAIWLVLAAGFVFAQQTPVNPILGPVPVLTVLDGDTVILESNLGPRIVRLIGIDTPEVSHPEKGREPFGPEASDFTKALLPAGTDVWVELDLEAEDAYGRLLAYLYLANPDGDWTIAGTPAVMVNEEIAAAGFARVLTIEPNAVYSDLFELAVAQAQVATLGMWSPNAPEESQRAVPEGREVPESEQSTVLGGGMSADIRIACARFDPAEGQEETVYLEVLRPLDTRGYFLHDADGSNRRIMLPAGVQQPGEIALVTEGQEIWNNGGDTIYLKFGSGELLVDAWDYRNVAKDFLEGTKVCR